LSGFAKKAARAFEDPSFHSAQPGSDASLVIEPASANKTMFAGRLMLANSVFDP
jgi:hypothetical protein